MDFKSFWTLVEAWWLSYFATVRVHARVLTDEVLTWLFGSGVWRSRAERAQVDAVIQVVILGVVAVVGLLVYTQVEGSLTLDVQGARDDPANATVLENASASVGDGFGDAVELVPIVMIVLIAGLVIAVIARFRG